MKVLKPGVDKLRTWKKVVKCSGMACMYENRSRNKIPCDAQLELNYNDVFVEDNPLAGNDKKFVFKCPECGSLTNLNRYELPDYIINYALKRKEKDIDSEKELQDGKDYISLE